MHHFAYRAGELHAEDVPVARIAAAVGTPFYCYATATLVRHYTVFARAFGRLDTLVCYAMKANSNLAVVRTLARLGAGVDVVSGGELRQALAAGVPPERIVFSGVGKSREEMALALDSGILQLNVESEPELRALSEVAAAGGRRAPVSIRVNPDVDARTHKKISTGHRETKFGVPWKQARALYAEAGRLPGIDVVGVDVHIGSQLTGLEPFEAAFMRVADLVRTLRADGHDIRRIDLGGGLGIPYDAEEPPLPEAYGAMVARVFGNLGCTLIFEPGRLIVGNAGILVTRVLYVKRAEDRTFLIVDAAMNDLIRPTLYDAFHRILPVREPAADAPRQLVDVVGPVCETGDMFAIDRPMPQVTAGDLLAIMSAGAYGAVMSSTYNSRPLVPEVMVNGGQFALVRRRPTFAEMMQLEAMPDWLVGSAPRSGG